MAKFRLSTPGLMRDQQPPAPCALGRLQGLQAHAVVCPTCHHSYGYLCPGQAIILDLKFRESVFTHLTFYILFLVLILMKLQGLLVAYPAVVTGLIRPQGLGLCIFPYKFDFDGDGHLLMTPDFGKILLKKFSTAWASGVGGVGGGGDTTLEADVCPKWYTWCPKGEMCRKPSGDPTEFTHFSP